MKKQITLLLMIACLWLTPELNAQGSWIEQAVLPGMTGIHLTRTGSDCIISTRASSRYVFFFDCYAKAWTVCDLGSQQNIKAVDAGKHVLLAYTDSLLVAYSSLTSTYQVIKYSGNILQPALEGMRGYGCGDKAAYAWTDANIFYVFDGQSAEWKSYNYGPTTNVTGYGYFWCGDSYVAGILNRNYPDKNRNVVYSLITGTFNLTETGGVYVATGFGESMTDGFVSMWGGAPDALQFTGYSAYTNEFYYVQEDTPYGAFYTNPITNDNWINFKERNVFGYCITRGSGVSQPRDEKINVFDTKRARWNQMAFTYPSNQFGEVAASALGGNIAAFFQIALPYYEITFYVYSGETGSFETLESDLIGEGGTYINSGNNFSVSLDNHSNCGFYNSKTAFSYSFTGGSNYVNAAPSSDYISFCRYNPESLVMDIWFYNSLTDRATKAEVGKDVYPDFQYSPNTYVFNVTSPEKRAVFYSAIHDSIFILKPEIADKYSGYGAIGTFAFLQSPSATLLFDAANLKFIERNAIPVQNGYSDSLVLYRSGNIFDVYDVSTENISTFDLGSTPGTHLNGGNILLISNSNFSKFYAFQLQRTEWVELIPEGNSMAYIASENTAVVVRSTKVYAFAPDFTTNVEDKQASEIQVSTLCQNYPNPFTKTTTITWQQTQDAHIVLKVYDFTGREIRTLVSENPGPGEHQLTFNAEGLPAGVYFYQLTINGLVETKKMILLK